MWTAPSGETRKLGTLYRLMQLRCRRTALWVILKVPVKRRRALLASNPIEE